MPPTSDRGDIVLGWLTKLVVAFAVAGVVAFDAISIGTAALAVTDDSTAVAREASSDWRLHRDVQHAYETALAAAHEADPLNEVPATSFRVDADGTVHLTVTRTAPTLVVHRVRWIEDWADVTGSGAGRAQA